jgi:hypothetical protein
VQNKTHLQHFGEQALHLPSRARLPPPLARIRHMLIQLTPVCITVLFTAGPHESLGMIFPLLRRIKGTMAARIMISPDISFEIDL